MKHTIRHRQGGNLSAGAKAGTGVEERRAAPRQHFVAEAQIVEITSGVKLLARSCDLVGIIKGS